LEFVRAGKCSFGQENLSKLVVMNRLVNKLGFYTAFIIPALVIAGLYLAAGPSSEDFMKLLPAKETYLSLS
jgi:hypothetical protein